MQISQQQQQQQQQQRRRQSSRGRPQIERPATPPTPTNHEYTLSTMAAEDAAKEQAAQMRKNRAKILLSLVPKIPSILRTFFLHVLGLSETARYLDLETDMIVAVLRATIGDSKKIRPVAETQAMSLLDPGVKGDIWISNAVSDVPPERGIQEALMGVIRSMSDAEARQAGFEVPDLVHVEAEWTGYRAGVAKDEPVPAIPEERKYEAMMKECKNATTVLYFHGGAYFLGDPATHRGFVKRLAKVFGGRVYSVRYRLAPQHPFPAALLDALVSYFTLLYPPPGSIHEPVSPRDIVFGGDSAGGNLALALTQTILQLRRQNTKIAWFGVKREVPLPAGITLLSPWIDIVESMPSWSTNRKWDYLPGPERLERAQPAPDAIWPAKPPRKLLYVADALRLHPLVTLHLAPSWAGAPPVWLACGWECLADEARYLVAKLRRDGVRVVFDEFEAMPHVFAVMLPRLPQTERCVQAWARFITASRKNPDRIVSCYTYVKAKTLEESEGDVERLTPYDEHDVFAMAYAKVGREAPALPLPLPLPLPVLTSPKL
ncbi:alpha/beta hydrolase fold-domain-containing protein [Xylaria sp. FL1777]|nr:alpha/beta hydrolase fold-domain-containing protein [Xylaria sp. FL1777]